MLYHTLFKKLILINRQVIDRQMDMHNKQQDLDLLAGHNLLKTKNCTAGFLSMANLVGSCFRLGLLLRQTLSIKNLLLLSITSLITPLMTPKELESSTAQLWLYDI